MLESLDCGKAVPFLVGMLIWASHPCMMPPKLSNRRLLVQPRPPQTHVRVFFALPDASCGLA
jgi:hypothetical protein